MRIHDQLDGILSRGSKVRILRYLFQEDDEHTGRGIARAVGMSPSMAHSVLSELSAEGLVDVREKGRAKLYRLRMDSYIVKKVLRPLFEGEKNLSKDLSRDLRAGIPTSRPDVLTVSIFGSVAAKKETVGSDLDLLVVVETASGKRSIQKSIDELGVDLAEKYGITLSPYVVTRGELKKKHSRELPLIKSILAGNQLIYGEPVERILA